MIHSQFGINAVSPVKLGSQEIIFAVDSAVTCFESISSSEYTSNHKFILNRPRETNWWNIGALYCLQSTQFHKTK